MTTPKNDPRLTAYALGQLPEAEAKDVERILQSSSEAREFVKKVQTQADALRLAFVTEALPAPSSSTRASSKSKWIILSGGVALLAFFLWILLPSGNGGVEEAGRKAKIILDPPIAVAVNGELGGIQIDVDGKAATIPAQMDPLLVRNVFQSHTAEVRECYDNNKGTQTEGSIVIVFEVNAKGRVRDAVIPKTDFKDVKLGACLTLRLMSWNFSKPKGSIAKVIYPIRFFH
jgi:hypothetical protein